MATKFVLLSCNEKCLVAVLCFVRSGAVQSVFVYMPAHFLRSGFCFYSWRSHQLTICLAYTGCKAYLYIIRPFEMNRSVCKWWKKWKSTIEGKTQNMLITVLTFISKRLLIIGSILMINRTKLATVKKTKRFDWMGYCLWFVSIHQRRQLMENKLIAITE